jgi:5'-3' exonuclease
VPTTLHLIDATYELFRAWFAVPPRTSPAGIEVGAVAGLSASLLAFLRDPEVTHVGCATDHVIESFRNDLFAGYKTAEGVDPALLEQFPIAEEAMRALGLVVWPMTRYEADDALATAVARYGPSFQRVVLATPDKDLAQCVSGRRVVQWDRRRDLVLDEEAVEAKFGVRPASIPDWLALVGDAADGLPGVPGFGAKTAAALLQAYGTIEAIPEDPAAWTVRVRGAPRLAESLAAHREAARRDKDLANLRTDVPLAESVDDLRFTGVPRDRWVEFSTRHGLGLETRSTRWR